MKIKLTAKYKFSVELNLNLKRGNILNVVDLNLKFLTKGENCFLVVLGVVGGRATLAYLGRKRADFVLPLLCL